MISVKVYAGPSAGAQFSVPSPAAFGRDPDLPIPLADAVLSRRHGTLTRDASGSLRFRDTSRNGTYLLMHGTTTPTVVLGSEVQLSPGDSLLLGSTALLVQEDPDTGGGSRALSAALADQGYSREESAGVLAHPFTRMALAASRKRKSGGVSGV